MELEKIETTTTNLLPPLKVLNNGYVSLVDCMGGDYSVVRNARRCWRSESSSSEKANSNLIKHLLKEKHMTPFEAVTFTFDVKTPLFVARQWFRHRVGSYNEESLRYCVADQDYYVPDGLDPETCNMWHYANERQFHMYHKLLEKGLKKELVRSILPVGMYTKFYWTVNGSSLMNFLKLRKSVHAQFEIKQYANAIHELVKQVAPVSFGNLDI